jgi:WD40 repeat protein
VKLVPLFFFVLMAMASAADPKSAMRVLRDQCIACHKPGKAKGGLLLTTREKMMKGGDSAAAVVEGKSAESLLYQLVLAGGDPHMPPKKQLSTQDIAALKSWIDAGAVWDASVFDEAPPARPVALQSAPSSYRPVLAMALSPDEKRLAVARANEVLMMDLTKPDRPVVGRLLGHVEPVQSIGWSQDGTRIVTGGYQRVIIWNAADLKQVLEVKDGLLGTITALSVNGAHQAVFIADGEMGGAGFIRKLDLTTGKTLATWKAHDDNVLALRLSAKGDRLLSGGADKLAKLWDAQTGKLISAYEGHTNHVLSVAFNKDGTQFATAGADREVKVWDVASREQDVSLGDKKVAFTGSYWTPDGKSLAVVTEKGGGSVYTELKKHVGTERSETAKERRLSGVNETLTSVVITADSKWVFAGGFDGKVYVWDAATGQPKDALKL